MPPTNLENLKPVTKSIVFNKEFCYEDYKRSFVAERVEEFGIEDFREISCPGCQC